METKENLNKGITLVALVITIIVLLILAGVTLSIVMNGNIIGRAQNAVNTYDDQSKNESQKLNWLSDEFQKYINNIPSNS